ncbi:hypothetical protein LTR49_028477 [Elasticomyces elasticus]|nr:hypothetical protein LTR49_028477 [Elasticomyces elasticus]
MTATVDLGKEFIAEELTTISSTKAAAVLIRRDSGPGSVVVAGHGTGANKPHVITGQGQGSVVIFVQKGQSCIIYGSPSIRVFAYVPEPL